MTLSYFRNIVFLLDLFLLVVHGADLNITGETITTRFWDCCKPSCSWRGKAPFNQPVQSCHADDRPADFQAGTGCGEGGNAYLCSTQQPWAINDTFSYGFAGVFLTGQSPETSWCCACYELNFTSDPLRGKTMIVQASNSAFDVSSTNRFSLAIPGGNTTSHDGCAKQYNVDQTVFGEANAGVSAVDDCDRLPDQLKDACRWRFDWFQDAQYPSATFKRVVCPKELTDKTGCVRNDEKELTGESAASSLSPTFTFVASFAMIAASLLSV